MDLKFHSNNVRSNIIRERKTFNIINVCDCVAKEEKKKIKRKNDIYTIE